MDNRHYQGVPRASFNVRFTQTTVITQLQTVAVNIICSRLNCVGFSSISVQWGMLHIKEEAEN